MLALGYAFGAAVVLSQSPMADGTARAERHAGAAHIVAIGASATERRPFDMGERVPVPPRRAVHPTERQRDLLDDRLSVQPDQRRHIDLAERLPIQHDGRSGDLTVGTSIPLGDNSRTVFEWTLGGDAGAAPTLLEAGATYFRCKPLVGLSHQATSALEVFGGVGAGPAYVNSAQTPSTVEASASSLIGVRTERIGTPMVVALAVDGVMHHGAAASVEFAIMSR